MAGGRRARRFAGSLGLIATATMLLAVPAVGAASPLRGALDRSFGHDGRAFSALGGSFAASEFTSMVRLADGKLLLGGWIEREGPREGEYESVIERRDPSGLLDAGFGQGGKVTVREKTDTPDGLSALAVQEDGAILFAAGGAVHRLRPDGTPDPAFGNGGVSAALPLGAGRLAIDAQGRIVVAGTVAHQVDAKVPPTHELALARLLPNGNFDPSFGEGGAVYSHIEDDFGESAGSALAIREDGTILVGVRNSLLAFAPDGSLDPAFGNSGVVELRGRQKALLDLPGNEMVVASSTSFACCPGPGDFTLSRYRSDGSLDPSFGQGGHTSLDIATIDEATALALAQDGSIILAGDSTAKSSCGGGECDFTPILARFTTAGELDPSFGQGGWTPLVAPEPLGYGDGPRIAALAIAPNGQIVAAGGAGGYSDAFVLARTPGGKPDPSFGNGGTADEVRALPSTSGAAGVAVDRDGEILTSGGSDVGMHGGQLVLLGFRPNGRPDLRFGSGSGFVPTEALHIAGRNGAYVAASDSGLRAGRVVHLDQRGLPDSRYGSSGVARLPAGFLVASLLARDDGSLFVLGRLTGKGRRRGMAVFKLTPAGRPDRRFGDNGFVLIGFGSKVKTVAESAAVDRRGRIVLAGRAGPAAAAARLLPNGRIDGSFSRDGRFTTVAQFWAGRTALALEPNGGILIAISIEGKGRDAVTLRRLDRDGVPDRSFGYDGVLSIRHFPTPLLSVFAGRGQIVVVVGRGGWGERGVTLRAYNPDGSLDLGFGHAGVVSAATSRTHVFRPVGAVRQADGRIVVAGTTGTIEELGARVELLRFR